jgi:hypothetical protein
VRTVDTRQNVLKTGQSVVDTGVLESAHDAQPGNRRHRPATKLLPFERDVASVGRLLARNAVQQARFARAVGSYDSDDVTPGDVEADGIVCGNATEALADFVDSQQRPTLACRGTWPRLGMGRK